jgi:hypothetical protein
LPRPDYIHTDTLLHYRQQLGLHDVANHFWLSGKEPITRQRTFITLRIFDAYVTSSLGLPRNLRVSDTAGTGIPTDAPYVASPEMLTASNANVELLEIMSNARESVFPTDTTTPGLSPRTISTAQLHELSTTLDRWSLKYHTFTRTDNDATNSATIK